MKPKKPSPRRVKLDNLGAVVGEMARIYREMRAGKVEHQEGRSFVWVLDKLRSGLEAQALERIEERLMQLEGGNSARIINGHAITDQTTH